MLLAPYLHRLEREGSIRVYKGPGDAVEGKFYLWTEVEVDELLGEDAAIAKAYFDISEAGNQYHHDVADEQPPQGSGVQEDPRAGATSGGGPLAGIPPPRRAYTMLAPREMKDRLESTRNRTDGSESDTVESVRTQAGGSATAGSNLPEASRAAEPARGAKVATSSTSRSTPAFQKMSHLGQMFCTALEQGNMGAAATSAVAVQEHGCGPLSLHL